MKALLFTPALTLGIIIFLVGGAMLLSVTKVYPLARYLALIVMGYLCVQSWAYLYEGWSTGWILLGAGLGWGLGIFLGTITLNFALFALGITAAVCAIGAWGWVAFLAV